MAESKTCPACGETYICDPDGECWCKALPPVRIPPELRGKGCLCRCVLERLAREQGLMPPSDADER